MSSTSDDIKALDHHSSGLQSYIDSPIKQRQLYRRTLLIVVISQIFGGAGLAAGITVGALLAQDMLGTDSFTGVPAALFTLGSAGAALLVGQLSQRFGRRLGLATGFLLGGIGAIGVVMSALTNNVLLLLVSLLIYGSGTATNLQARYAGTDLANSRQRATAISIAMVSTTFGAVAGPNLVDVMGRFAMSIGVPALAGPFILAAAAYIIAGMVLLVFLRPDPLIVAKAIATDVQNQNERDLLDANSISLAVNKRGIIVGATVMVLTQIVMIAIMTMTPVHMGHHGHNLKAVGLVIGFHVGAMYLPSLLTGILVDKIGRKLMALASGATLLAAAIVAAIAPADSILVLIIALSLLGLGWNFGLISGTALILDSTHPSTRAKTQGSVDVLIALAGASGGALSGMVLAYSSYTTLSLAGGILSLLLIPVVFWRHSKHK
ncbi:MFS transporter [Paenibacillus macquariensis]|uniref:Sugar phosphate permease n=1 Tax=Paenibacillus macquariensis TaxID=948756 RepID=A0ABY1JPU8_9BACL|nr:MFS transporter [Paenibacillus macquariensis]MEC0094064.1 MFS transporter [Paenibacillus macquariensis]OAB37527.1 MFS transporter [Paenibacillus macquariensis subsp. macquariensis]SIQ55574.1 Sugar phosphate permease [Paenibacillus macquariensis]